MASEARSAMEVKPAHIVILDISGYTKFIRKHRLALLHAEHIINDLLEHVIAAIRSPLVVNKLQGDAVLLYALTGEGEDSTAPITDQVVRAFDAFRKRERELVSDCSLCSCDACASVKNLHLKAIMHHGKVVFKRVQRFDEIAGEDVIMAHRLLKNSIKAQEYILMSDAVDAMHGGVLQAHRRETRQEQCAGFGKVDVVAYYPDASAEEFTPKRTFAQRFMMSLVMDGYILGRLFRKPAQRYHNLDRAQGRDAPDRETA